MYLVDEQHVMRFEVGQDRRQIARLLEHRARGLTQIDLHFIGDNMRQRGLAEPGRSEDQHVIQRFPALHRVLVNKYYVDELYDRTVVRGTWSLAGALFAFDKYVIDGFFVNGARHLTVGTALVSGFFDQYFVDGAVNAFAVVSRYFSRVFRRLQGGLVAVAGGKVLASLCLPIAGLLSNEPLEVVVAKLERLDQVAKDLGTTLPSPFATLSFMTLPVIPELRLTDLGLVDVNEFKLIE